MKSNPFLSKIMVALLVVSWAPGTLGSLTSAAGLDQPDTGTIATIPADPITNSLQPSNVSVPVSEQPTVATATYLTSSLPTLPPAVLTPPTNTTRETAIEIKPDTPIESYLPPSRSDGPGNYSGGILYYKVTLTERQKMTFMMLMPPGINYHMFMESTAGFRSSGPYQQLNYVGGPGTYYLEVTEGGTPGSLTVPFNLRLVLSPKFDDYEQYSDDSFVTEVYDWGPTRHTIDNPFDEDWKALNIPENGKLTLSLDNPSNSKGVYKAELYDQNSRLIGTVYQNAPKTFDIPMNGYYTRVYSAKGSYDPDVYYTLSLDFKTPPKPVCDWEEGDVWVCTWPK